MLWNIEVGRVLLIDFGRSCVSHPSNHQKMSSLRTEVLPEVLLNRNILDFVCHNEPRQLTRSSARLAEFRFDIAGKWGQSPDCHKNLALL
jgi:hypothetical protein